jgi:hypothetical protein
MIGIKGGRKSGRRLGVRRDGPSSQGPVQGQGGEAGLVTGRVSGTGASAAAPLSGTGPFDRRVIGVGGIVFAALMALSTRHGFHRDELYFLACAQHLQASYVDQPVLSPLLAGRSHAAQPVRHPQPGMGRPRLPVHRAPPALGPDVATAAKLQLTAKIANRRTSRTGHGGRWCWLSGERSAADRCGRASAASHRADAQVMKLPGAYRGRYRAGRLVPAPTIGSRQNISQQTLT